MIKSLLMDEYHPINEDYLDVMMWRVYEWGDLNRVAKLPPIIPTDLP